MPYHMSLFADFPAVSKEEWLAKVAAELKGRDPADLAWPINESLQVSPFRHHSEQAAAPRTLTTDRATNSWAIGEYCTVTEAAAANRQILEGLMGGVTAPLLYISAPVDVARLLDTINPAYVSLHFALAGSIDQLDFVTQLQGFLAEAENTSGTIHWANAPSADVYRRITEQLPHWRTLVIDGRNGYQQGDPVSELTMLVEEALAAMDRLQDDGLTAAEINAQLHFHLRVGTSYPVNIAKLRALNIVWANVLAAYGLPEAKLPPVIAHCTVSDGDVDQYTQMIHAATQALTAALGGARRIYVEPADGGEGSSFTRRIARNVQHLLQLEAGVDRVVDPVAGSYYLEDLTDRIAQAVWDKIKQ